ncbi:MAG: T9SS type A sorting domain-containing protein [Saprospiraceae bacterium]
MKQLFTILALLCFTTVGFSANIAWKTSVASGNWEDGSNWSGGAVPGTSDVAIFKSTVTVTSAAGTQTVGGIKVTSSSSGTVPGNVTLNLDLDITSSTHAILINDDNAAVTLGTGTFNISATGSAGIRFKGNNQTLNITSDATVNITSANNGIQVFNNSGTTSGSTLTNAGTINITTSGTTNASIATDASTTSSITNEGCGLINLGGLDGEAGNPNRIKLNGTATFVNNGLMKYTGTGVGIFLSSGGTSTVTNNAFFNYANSGTFGSGTGGTATDNGVDVSSGNITVDAMTSCAVTNIGIASAHTWFKEAANTTQAGTNDGAGALTLDNGVWPGEAAGTKTVYSCFGAEFTLTIDNVDGGCLPVEMMYFNGELKGEAIALNWATASELNNAGFEVQKSADGVNWDVLGFVNGNGTTIETQTYAFVDKSPLAKNYYRLKQMDYNDVFAYSNTIIINGNVKAQTATATVYPNPTKGMFNIEVEINDNAQVNVFNNFGQLVKTVQLTNQNTNVSLDEFANGLYYLQIVNGQTIQNQTIVKQ